MNANTINKKKRFLDSWTFIIIVCIILPICFRAFLYSPRHIPSSSMKPTLLIGDYIFISKFSYGYSSYSFPLGYKFNYFDGRIGNEEPKRGDIIVFRPENNPSVDFIKRLIGMPGDKIKVKDGKVYLNGAQLPQKRIEDFVDTKESGPEKGRKVSIKRFEETLPNGITYEVLDEIDGGNADNTVEYTVPENHYFFLGDNRDNSSDSRLSVGFVPHENLIGRAEIVFFSNETDFIKIWEWVVSFRSDRFILDLYEEQ